MAPAFAYVETDVPEGMTLRAYAATRPHRLTRRARARRALADALRALGAFTHSTGGF